MYQITMQKSHKILCQTKNSQTILNNKANVYEINDKPFNNGILLGIDRLLIPPAFETTFKDYIAC